MEFRNFDSFILAFGPIYQLLVATTTIFNIILVDNIYVMLGFTLLSYLGTVILSLFLCIVNKKKIIPLLPAILLFSLFMVTGIISVVLAIFNPNKTWEEIKHDKKISIDEI